MARPSASSSWEPERRSRSRMPAMPHMALHPYHHTIIGDFPTRRLNSRSLRRILAQHWVRIIDMDENLTLDPETGEGSNRAAWAGDVHMADALPGLVHQPLHDHLVVGVERAVEKQQRCPFESRRGRRVDFGAVRHIKEMAVGPGLGYVQPDRVTLLSTQAC